MKSFLKSCLILLLIIVVLVLILITIFIYFINFKETEILSSQSPNGKNVIEIVEKGETAFFFPSTVRVKYKNKYIERMVSNDGKMLNDSNFTISWQNDTEATITLYGEEQKPDTINFNAEKSNPFELGEFVEEYKVKESNPLVHDGQGSFTFKRSNSPGLINIIEFRETSAVVQIYYGKMGSVLGEYIEYIPSDMYTPENFNVEWKNDEQAKVDVMRENEIGEMYIEESIEIDMTK